MKLGAIYRPDSEAWSSGSDYKASSTIQRGVDVSEGEARAEVLPKDSPNPCCETS